MPVNSTKPSVPPAVISPIRAPASVSARSASGEVIASSRITSRPPAPAATRPGAQARREADRGVAQERQGGRGVARVAGREHEAGDDDRRADRDDQHAGRVSSRVGGVLPGDRSAGAANVNGGWVGRVKGGPGVGGDR